MDKITEREFVSRIEALCVNRGNPGLPRKRRDQLILLQSIVLVLDPRRVYPETEVNDLIERWLVEVGRAVDTDHVTLRRLLVDEGWLSRDAAGEAYRVETARTEEWFEPEVKGLDPGRIVAEAQVRRDQRKDKYLGSEDGD